MGFSRAALSFVFAMTSFAAVAADYPTPKQGDWIARDFKFHTGETMAELKLHYTTIGDPGGQPVLVLHGSGGSATNMLTPAFAGELFGPGQPLDASKYYIVLPDGLGHGKSSKPSDGLKTMFPKYDYTDMVDAQYRLVTEGLGIKHFRLVIGNSMGGWRRRITGDANDFVYQWEAAHDYDPSGGLERIEANVLAINAADDERNPPETGVTEAAIKRIKNARLYLIPASTETRGHLATGNAKFYKEQLRELLQSAPQHAM